MYEFVLILHNYLRWIVLIVGLAAIIMAWAGVASKARWTPPQRNLGRLFTGVFDLQVLVGIVLYIFLSPVTQAAFSDMGAAMKNSAIRFFVVEHLVGMVIAAIVVHIGAARGKSKDSPLQAAIFYTIGLLIVLAAIPWDRPLF